MNIKDLAKELRAGNGSHLDYDPIIDEAADTLEKLNAVYEAAKPCVVGCRRCNTFERYEVLKQAIAAVKENE